MARQHGVILEAIIGACDHVPTGRDLMDLLPGPVFVLRALDQEQQIVGFGGRLPLDENTPRFRLRRGSEVEQGHTGLDHGGQGQVQAKQADENGKAPTIPHG